MFDRLFAFIRTGVRDAILGGIEDARDEIANRIETDHEPRCIETTEANGRAVKRKPAAK